MKTINLKDDEGHVIEVNEDSCYPPSERDEYYMVNLNKFTYFRGKKTDDPVNVTEEQIRKSFR